MNLIVGDSHSNDIVFQNSTHLLCSAGSAKGLNNPNSISQYNKIIIDNVKNNNYDNLFFLFGGVDVDFCFIHKYLQNNSIDYKNFNSEVVDDYLEFIEQNFYDRSVVILSVGLPVLDDINLKKGILNAHVNHLENQDIIILEKKLSSCRLPNIYKRTKITLHFNEELKDKIMKLNNPNIKYLDVTRITYDFELKRIKDNFFTRHEHHNNERKIYINNIIDIYLAK